MKLHVIVVLSFVSIISVNCQCFEYCFKREHTCAKNVASHPVEKLKRRTPCEENVRRVYCCKSEEGYQKFMKEKKLQDLARVIAGAEENEYPHQVQFRGENGTCGGTIYNKNWVITAAHCINFRDKVFAKAGGNYTRIYAGLSSVKQVPEKNRYEIDEIIQHEKWDPFRISSGHDIALLHLATPLNLKIGKIQPLRLDMGESTTFAGGKAVIVGFGNVHSKLGIGSKYLMEAEVPIHDNPTATRLSLDPLNAEGQGGFVPLPQHISIGGGDSGITVGKGDSGGPLICSNKSNKPVLCGVASFKRCKAYKVCRKPNYYIRIAPFVDWIKEKINYEAQEEDYIFNEPMFPVEIKQQNVPGYLVRISGLNKSCSGVLIDEKVILTPAECVEGNGGQTKLHLNTIIYHYSTGKHLMAQGPAYQHYKPAISQNISEFLRRPLGLNNNAFILLKKPFTEGGIIQLPPKDFNLNAGVSIEYTYNENSHSVEARRYLPIDREECQERIHAIDKNLTLNEQHLCMRQVYSAETECDRDIGGPLICKDKATQEDYLCGMKIFHGCRFSGFPQIFNNYLRGQLRKLVESLKTFS